MGCIGTFKCLICGNEFSSEEGGGWLYSLYRCVQCDRIKYVTIRPKPGGGFEPTTSEEIGKCRKCGGELRNDIGPMCFKCHGRNAIMQEIRVFLD